MIGRLELHRTDLALEQRPPMGDRALVHEGDVHCAAHHALVPPFRYASRPTLPRGEQRHGTRPDTAGRAPEAPGQGVALLEDRRRRWCDRVLGQPPAAPTVRPSGTRPSASKTALSPETSLRLHWSRAAAPWKHAASVMPAGPCTVTCARSVGTWERLPVAFQNSSTASGWSFTGRASGR